MYSFAFAFCKAFRVRGLGRSIWGHGLETGMEGSGSGWKEAKEGTVPRASVWKPPSHPTPLEGVRDTGDEKLVREQYPQVS